MTENDLRPRSVGRVKCTVMILTIIIVTIIVVTFLCTHYTAGRSLSEIPESSDIHRHVDHSGNERNGLSEKSNATVVDLDEPHTSVGRSQPRIAPTESVSESVGDPRASKFRSAWTGESGSRVWPLVGRGRLTAKTNPYPTDRDRDDVTDPTIQLWDINSRSNRHNLLNTKSGEWSGHHASDDLTYNLNQNDVFKHTDTDLIGGIGLKPYYSFGNGDYYGPIAESPSIMHYPPSLRPPPMYPVLSPQTKISVSKKEKFDWHTIGLLTLIKVGLIKLKLFGILKILFLLLFKLKLFLIAIFIKFLLLLKSAKILKTLFLPLLILPLFLILLILPIIMSTMYLLPRQSLNMMSPSPTDVSPSISNQLSNLISNLPGIPARLGLTKSFTNDQSPNISKKILAGRFGTLRFNDFSFHSKYDPEPSAIIVTALNIFQKLLDSKKCVERIACQMAAVGKAGIMPHWINRLLNSVLSMFIAVEKGKTYVTTYNDVNNDILINFSAPNSWTTWFMERYDCNRTIISNTTETEL